MTTIISSQRYINDAIVSEKIQNKDFKVSLSPEFELEGQKYQVVLDGHHSLKAAIQSGAEPELETAAESENDNIAILNSGDIEGFLEAVHIDSDYYDTKTEKDIW